MISLICSVTNSLCSAVGGRESDTGGCVVSITHHGFIFHNYLNTRFSVTDNPKYMKVILILNM